MDTLETKLLDDAKRGATGVALSRTPGGKLSYLSSCMYGFMDVATYPHLIFILPFVFFATHVCIITNTLVITSSSHQHDLLLSWRWFVEQ